MVPANPVLPSATKPVSPPAFTDEDGGETPSRIKDPRQNLLVGSTAIQHNGADWALRRCMQPMTRHRWAESFLNWCQRPAQRVSANRYVPLREWTPQSLFAQDMLRFFFISHIQLNEYTKTWIERYGGVVIRIEESLSRVRIRYIRFGFDKFTYVQLPSGRVGIYLFPSPGGKR